MPDPRFLSWDQWSALTASQHLTVTDLPRRVPEEKWQQWALFASGAPEFAGLEVPRPQFFKSWREWAQRFNAAIAVNGPI